MLKSVLPLSFIAATRFFGLFIILPVISVYALELNGANELLVGVLVGSYAIVQVIFQIPFGRLSDKFGRKITMLFGLLIFIAGSIVCANATDIYTMILGRLLQGAGAIGAVATAMISDMTNEEVRGKAMAIMGIFIGLSFSISMVLSPILSAKFGISSLFYISAALSALCIIILYAAVPKEPKIQYKEATTPFFKLLSNRNLFLMNTSNFMQKMLTSVAFVVIPIIIVREFGIPKEELWKIYAVATLFGFVAMGAGGAIGEKRGLSKQILLGGVVLFIAAYVIFALAGSVTGFYIGVTIFFVGFNLHEPIMQSMASKFAKISEKGTALGVFNSSGYMGSFVGGVGAGFLLKHSSLSVLCAVFVVLCAVWLVMLRRLDNPAMFKNLYLPIDKEPDFGALDDIEGIVERYKTAKNYVVKYNSSLTDEARIAAALDGR